jgi:hypothetical protein
MKIVDFTGTVSWGTMQPRDLVPSFMDVLSDYHKDEYDTILVDLDNLAKDIGFESYENVLELTREDPFTGPTYKFWQSEIMSYILNEDIWDAMNEIAPHGYHFGSSEGDGSDYGYWKFDDEDDLDSREDGMEEVDDGY